MLHACLAWSGFPDLFFMLSHCLFPGVESIFSVSALLGLWKEARAV